MLHVNLVACIYWALRALPTQYSLLLAHYFKRR
jgi:hypothetical protein